MRETRYRCGRARSPVEPIYDGFLHSQKGGWSIRRFILKCLGLYTLLRLRLQHGASKVSLRCHVDSCSTVGDQVKISDGCRVLESSLGYNTRLNENCSVTRSAIDDYVVLGANSAISECHVGSFSYLGSGARLFRTRLGKFCSVAADFLSSPGMHPARFVSTSPVFWWPVSLAGVTFCAKESFSANGSVDIGNDVWIGARVVVRDGVRVGDGAIIGAGAVVVDNVAPYAIVGGVPAKLIRFRFEERTIQRLLITKWWEWPEDRLRAAQPYFATDKIEEFLDWAESLDNANTTNAG